MTAAPWQISKADIPAGKCYWEGCDNTAIGGSFVCAQHEPPPHTTQPLFNVSIQLVGHDGPVAVWIENVYDALRSGKADTVLFTKIRENARVFRNVDLTQFSTHPFYITATLLDTKEKLDYQINVLPVEAVA